MSLSRIRIVLVETTHPGNIGATARAMKTMGLMNLYLVNPKIFPSAEATAMAAGADDILANAHIVSTLAEAIQDCGLVIGSSARNRTIPWPVKSPRDCAREFLSIEPGTHVAVLFGRESSGLSNEELESCNLVIQIPTNPDFSSLNLAAAVQIIGYEFSQANTINKTNDTDHQNNPAIATSDEMEKFYHHLESVMIDTGFYDPEKPRKLMRRMKRLFNRSQMDQNELSMMRGFLASIDKKNEKED